jgi:hypothetical protein
MKRFLSLSALFLCAASALFPTISARADTGPHPTMDFQLVWSIPHVSVTDASLYTCGDMACADPIQVGGPFSCSEESCRYNYGSEGFYKLVIVFEDQTRASNIFEKRGFEAAYVVQVNLEGLFVEQTNLSVPYDISTQVFGFVIALLLTLAIEIPIGNMVLKRWSLPRRWMLILYANLITLPIVWFGFPFISPETLYVICLAELFAWIFEAAFYFLAMRKDGIKLTQAIILSLLANLASLTIPALCLLLIFVSYQL